MTGLEGAVKRLEPVLSRLWGTMNPPDVQLADDIDTILDALASITRERDEARDENERLRLLFLGGEDAPGLAASLSFQQIADAHRSNLDFAADVVSGLTRERDAIRAESDETNGLLEEMRRQLTIAQDERDAMREGLRPFAELADWYASQEDDSFEVWRDFPHGGPRNLLRLGNFRRAAALVNGEVGE